jgi:hypothetical protein
MFTCCGYYRDHNGVEREEGAFFAAKEDALAWAQNWLKHPGRRAIVRQGDRKRMGKHPLIRIFDQQS